MKASHPTAVLKSLLPESVFATTRLVLLQIKFAHRTLLMELVWNVTKTALMSVRTDRPVTETLASVLTLIVRTAKFVKENSVHRLSVLTVEMTNIVQISRSVTMTEAVNVEMSFADPLT